MIDREFILTVHDENTRNAKLILIHCAISLLLCGYTVLVVFVLNSITSAPPAIEAFATDKAGVEIKLSPVVNPSITEEQAWNFVTGASIDLMSIRFDVYPQQIRAREHYFYADGFGRYRDNLYQNVVPIISKELLIVTAINVGKPKLTRYQRLGDTIQRTYQLMMLQTTQGPTSDTKTEKRVVVITVIETPRDESINGLQIKRFFVTG